MQGFLKVYRQLNLLSLDVALGSVCGALFFSKLFQVTILLPGLIALALTVWVVYTTDHLLDAVKITEPASTHRHRFHQKNFSVLIKAVLIVALVNGVIIFFIRKPLFWGGILLFTAVGAYLILQQFTKAFKELCIALFYTAGVALPSMVNTPVQQAFWPWIVLIQFSLLAFFNLIMFAWFDLERDREDRSTSIVTIIGERKSRYIMWILSVLIFTLTFWSEDVRGSIFILIGCMALMLMLSGPRYFAINDRFRLMGDAIFFLPVLYWLL